MPLLRSTAEIFVPDGKPRDAALGRITHLGIGAHPDDLEFMAFHGIIACYEQRSKWFGGVTCTDGAGSARAGRYADVNDVEMRNTRRAEQNRAAELGRYGAMIHLNYPSARILLPGDETLREDLAAILRATRPDVVYTHNLADKHETHVGVALAAIQAMRSLPRTERPATVYGCEGWRGLDWMLDREKILHDLSGHASLADALNGVFDSQINSGKRYDLGVTGRRHANATFFDAHTDDGAESLALAMDLSPLMRDDQLDLVDYVDGFIARFREDVRRKLKARLVR